MGKFEPAPTPHHILEGPGSLQEPSTPLADGARRQTRPSSKARAAGITRRGAEGLSFPQQPRLSGTWVFPGCGPPPCPVPAAKGCHLNHLSNSSSWTLSPGPPTGRPPTPECVCTEPGSRAGSRGHGAAIIPAHVRGHGGHLGKRPGARACRARGPGPAGAQALARAGPGVPYLAASRLS